MCVTEVFNSPKVLTHHDSSDPDAHVPYDVEFTVEEVLDAHLTVLQTKDKRTQSVLRSRMFCLAP